MKSEVCYRLLRITLVIMFLIVAVCLRNDAEDNYNYNTNIYNSLMNSLQVANVTEENDIGMLSTNEKLSYKIKVTNSSDITKKFDFYVNENDDNTIDYKYINYEIVCNDKVLETGKLNNKNLYTGNIPKNTALTYTINFSLADSDNDFNNEKFSANITVM